MATPSDFDNETGPLSRDHINAFIRRTAVELSNYSGRMLEIGPQDRSLVRECFSNFSVDTLDLTDAYHPSIVGDITKTNSNIAESSYDCVACIEVLEHTLNPFDAVKEIRRILKHGGFLLASAPLNWRIHGPIPDCWRFTEHGWKALLRDFEILEIDSFETPGRELFPLGYTVLAKCDKFKNTKDHELKFRWI